MINILGSIPREKFFLACSGGKDSMVILDFLLRFPKYNFEVLYFDHGTTHGKEAREFVSKRCGEIGVAFSIGEIERSRLKNESKEEYWRNQRYSFFKKFSSPIVMCHHLDDVLETWIMGCATGTPKLIPYRNENVIRPFLITEKESINEWANRNSVEWIEDPSNEDVAFKRNLVRRDVVPLFEKINQGIRKTLKKKILDRQKLV